MGVIRGFRRLNASHEDQDQDDDKHQSEAAAGIVSPTRAVTPVGKSSDKDEEENDKKDSGHRIGLFYRGSRQRWRVRAFQALWSNGAPYRSDQVDTTSRME